MSVCIGGGERGVVALVMGDLSDLVAGELWGLMPYGYKRRM